MGLIGVSEVNYDGRVFHPIGAVPVDGEITTGVYHQDGDLVWAEIKGPSVRVGRLVGSVAADGAINAAYSQVMADGEVIAGRVVSRPTVLPDGRVHLSESWQRIDGSSGASCIEEPSRRDTFTPLAPIDGVTYRDLPV